jgi:hypothetical protein
MEQTVEEQDQMYVAFVKSFAPILLHFSSRNTNIRPIIDEFTNMREDEVPDHAKVDVLRTWVDSIQDQLGELSGEEIQEIMSRANMHRIPEKAFYKEPYSLSNKKRARGETCTITMDPFKRDEYYVDFLDKGKPYKVAAILQYYKLMKESNIERTEWKTPLRNPIDEKQEKMLEDLDVWYNESRRCKRSRKSRSNKSKRGGRRRITLRLRKN